MNGGLIKRAEAERQRQRKQAAEHECRKRGAQRRDDSLAAQWLGGFRLEPSATENRERNDAFGEIEPDDRANGVGE